jgi:hypothetical protein
MKIRLFKKEMLVIATVEVMFAAVSAFLILGMH